MPSLCWRCIALSGLLYIIICWIATNQNHKTHTTRTSAKYLSITHPMRNYLDYLCDTIPTLLSRLYRAIPVYKENYAYTVVNRARKSKTHQKASERITEAVNLVLKTQYTEHDLFYSDARRLPRGSIPQVLGSTPGETTYFYFRSHSSMKRMIHTSLWENEKFWDLDPYARLLFIGMITMADDEGRGKAWARYLVKMILPYDDQLATNWQPLVYQVGQAMKWAVTIYKVDDEWYYEMKNWKEHQILRNDRFKKSAYPSPKRGYKYSWWQPTGQPHDNQRGQNDRVT